MMLELVLLCFSVLCHLYIKHRSVVFLSVNNSIHDIAFMPHRWDKMRPIVTDVPWSECLHVCLLVTTLTGAKMAKPIEMLFRIWTYGGPS